MSVQREDGVTSGSSDDTGVRLGRVESELRQLRTDVDVIKATAATKDDLDNLQATMFDKFSELKIEMHGGRARTEAEINLLRAETKAEFEKQRMQTKAEIADARAVIIMWVSGVVFLAQLIPTMARVIEKYV